MHRFKYQPPKGARLLVTGTLNVPSKPEIVRGKNRPEFLVWPEESAKEREFSCESLGPPLLDFIRLGEEPTEQIVNFALKWGILNLCKKHCKPLSHNPEPRERYTRIGERTVKVKEWSCLPSTFTYEGKPSICEPVIAWRHYMVQGKAMLQMGSKLWGDAKGKPSDWQDEFHVLQSPPPREFYKLPGPPSQRVPLKGLWDTPDEIISPDVSRRGRGLAWADHDGARQGMADFVNAWMDWSGLRLRFNWSAGIDDEAVKAARHIERSTRQFMSLLEGKRRLTKRLPSATVRRTPSSARVFFEAPGLFGILAFQMLLAMSRIRQIALCTECGFPYVPSRSVFSGKRNFCPKCGRSAAMRSARKAYLDRQRHQSGSGK